MAGIKNFLLQQHHAQAGGTLPAPRWDYIRQYSREHLTQRLAELITKH
jgi:hypothetical protein